MNDKAAAARLEAEERTARELLRTLSRDYAGVVDASVDSNADDEHDPEGATIAFERSQLGAMIEQARHRLDEVTAALGRVADGTYGRCERCGNPIDPARLVARPTARTCVTCAGQRR